MAKIKVLVDGKEKKVSNAFKNAVLGEMVGRVMRPHKNKASGWVVDLGGNINFFGKIETMRIEQTPTGLYYISNNNRQLTNVTFQKM